MDTVLFLVQFSVNVFTTALCLFHARFSSFSVHVIHFAIAILWKVILILIIGIELFSSVCILFASCYEFFFVFVYSFYKLHTI